MKKDSFGRREAQNAGKPVIRPATRPLSKQTKLPPKPSIVRKDVGPSSLWEVFKRLFR